MLEKTNNSLMKPFFFRFKVFKQKQNFMRKNVIYRCLLNVSMLENQR